MKEQNAIISLFNDLKNKMGIPLIIVTFLQIIVLLVLAVGESVDLRHPTIEFFLSLSIALFVTSIILTRNKVQLLVSLLFCIVLTMIFAIIQSYHSYTSFSFELGRGRRYISYSVIYVCMIFTIIGQMIVSVYKHSKE